MTLKNKIISYKTIKWLCVAALVIALIPLLLLGRYAVPAADDFSYGAYAHIAYEKSGSLLDVVSAAVDKTVESYYSWQGTFSAIFLMALQPAVFSESLYAFTPFIMLIALIIGSFMFCRAFFAEVLGLDRELCDIIASLLCLFSTQLLPSPVQGLYWYNGAVYYMFFHGLCLIACAVGIRLVRQGGIWRGAVLSLMCLVLGGGNYVTALTLTILAVSLIALMMLNKNAAWKRLVLPGLALIVAFTFSIAAPGNAVRQAAQENTPGVFYSVLMSFESGVKYGLEWFTLPVMALLLFFGLVSWRGLKKSGFAFPGPVLVSLFSYCLFSAMFCPPIFAMGNVGDKRLLNMIYFANLLILVVNLIYWLGWLTSRRGDDAAKQGGTSIILLAVGATAVLCACAMAMLNGTGFSSVGAVSTLLSGEAQEYYACAEKRFEVLNDDSVKDVVLDSYTCKPYLLYFDDVTDDPLDWRNEDISTFYGKNSVILK